MQKRLLNLFLHLFFYPFLGLWTGKEVEKVKGLTFEDRKSLEKLWADNFKPVQIAARLGISQCTVYTELKRGQSIDGAGDLVLDGNFRPAYSAEMGEMVYQRNLRNRGRRPKEAKGA